MKLKKCPYCGSEHICTELSFDEGKMTIWCDGCPAQMQFHFADYGLDDGRIMSVDELEEFIRSCAEAWDRRAE